MRQKIFHWLGREFVALSCEATSGETAAQQAQHIFDRFDQELRGVELSLENTVRTRLWARDPENRNLASDVRWKVLSGKARASSSSFIVPDHFDSDAQIGLDLIAMRPSRPGLEKTHVEYDPPVRINRYIIYDSFVFVTGVEAVTALHSALAHQLADILSLISCCLAQAGTSWDQVVQVSSFLRRTQNLETFKDLQKEVVAS